MTLSMSPVTTDVHAGTPDTGGRPPRGRHGVPLLLQATAMLGLGALLYPAASDWFATLEHDADVSGYIEQVDAMPDAARQSALRDAEAYNARMPAGVLRDPFSAAASAEESTADYAAYGQLLSVDGGDIIGELDYPALRITLPIRHGTGDDAISEGVGHLYGSSLPIGGPSTHSVLTSHSGLVYASLFTQLTRADRDDVFTVTVLGDTHWYRVDRIDTVEPDDTEALQIVNGEDHVTLITCTPIGINSHRLLVRGTRIDAPEASAAGAVAIAGDGRSAGFPWWALAFVGGSSLSAWILFAPVKRRREKEASA